MGIKHLDEVKNFLKENGWSSQSKIAVGLGSNYNVVGEALWYLVEGEKSVLESRNHLSGIIFYKLKEVKE